MNSKNIRVCRSLESFELGTKFLLAGHAQNAVTSLAKAVELEPLHFPSTYNLVVAFCANGMRKEALELTPRLTEMAPMFARAWLLSASVFDLNGDDEQAGSFIRAAYLLDPNDAVVSACFGKSRVVNGDIRGVQNLKDSIAAGTHRSLSEISALTIAGQVQDIESINCNLGRTRELCVQPGVMNCVIPRFERSSKSRTQVQFEKPSSKHITVQSAVEQIQEAKSIIAITGAGMSAPSGLRTRKDLWSCFDRDEAVSVWRARENPQFLWGVIREFLGNNDHSPNAAHRALLELPQLAGIITQNVDGLHQVAMESTAWCGDVIELHGSFNSTSCWECGENSKSCFEWAIESKSSIPACLICGGALRPDVVLFGEPVLNRDLTLAKRMMRHCDLVLVIGCAMDVAPASELPRMAVANGARVIEFKRTPSRLGRTLTTQLVPGCVSQTIPEIVKCLNKPQKGKV